MLSSLPAEIEDLSTDRFRSAFEHALLPAWICTIDQRYTDVNDSLCTLLGTSRESIIGKALWEFEHPAEREGNARELAAIVQGRRDGYTQEMRLVRADGGVVWVLVALRLIRDGDGSPLYFVGQGTDVTEQHLREQRLRHLADHDPLTGLLNRRGFGRELRRHISRLARYGTSGALLMLDLDNFKRYNDTFGHAGGDDLLQAVAGGLTERLRGGDVLGRIGGDEFAVLLPEATQEQADVVADALVQAVRELGQKAEVQVTASVGVFCFDEVEGVSEDRAMVGADLAMYAAKNGGRNRHVPFSDRTPQGIDPTLVASEMAVAAEARLARRRPGRSR